jgi:hypothetical protein
MTLATWIQSIGIFIAIIGVIITMCNNRKQLKVFNEQLKLNFFADYTKRYQEIILNFPESINHPDFDYQSLSKENRNKTLRYMRVYFDLCSEEYDLYRAGYISERIWKNWKEGIEFAFSKKAFRDAWSKIKMDTIYYPEFTNWVESIIKEENKTASAIR